MPTEINQTEQKVFKLIGNKSVNWVLCFPQAHRNSVQAEWQAFLNLCLAQETHLDNIEDYRKVQDLWLHNTVTDCVFLLNQVFPVHHCSFLQSDCLFIAVPAGCRDAVWVPGETQFHSGPEVSGQQEQPWSLVGTGGTTVFSGVKVSFQP